ncbi:hypothetical protein BIW11_11480, partial [Tropilaelaps mercedesae]
MWRTIFDILSSSVISAKATDAYGAPSSFIDASGRAECGSTEGSFLDAPEHSAYAETKADHYHSQVCLKRSAETPPTNDFNLDDVRDSVADVLYSRAT